MTDNKLSELKAAAMAATPGPWILYDDLWSEGDNANVSTEERCDGRIVGIAQIEGGGSESGFDEPFSTEQQANAAFIAAANPAVVLELLTERDADKKRIAELEVRLATPVRLPGKLPGEGYSVDAMCNWARNERVKTCAKAIRAAGFTVEGDE